MLQKAKNSLPYILAATIISTFLVVAVLYAWTEPGVTPPGDNVPAPLNVGTAWQIKQGGIALNAGGHQAAGLIVEQGNVGIGDTTPGVKLDVAGNVRANAFYYHSDQVLKREIKPIENSLERVLRLEPVSFEWKEDGKYSLGLIAQDVAKVFPEVVFEKEGEKSVAYGKLVAPLIEAIREQQAQIEASRAEIEKLKTR